MKSVSVELVVLAVRDGRLEALLVRRPASVWGLPGAPAGEGRLQAVALEALAEQVGVRDVALEQLYTFDRGEGSGLAVAYLTLIAGDRHPPAPGAGVVEVRWFPLGDLPALRPEQAETLRYGHGRLRAKSAYAPVVFGLLGRSFTLRDLQAVYEAVLGTPLDPRNFRRDVLAAGVVEPIGRARAARAGRPAQLYRATGGDFAVLARERRIARLAAPTGGTDVEGPGGSGGPSTGGGPTVGDAEGGW